MSYAALNAKSNFSFLEGASHPDELVGRASQLGYKALAITDRNSLAGVVRAHVAAKEVGLKLLVGAEVTPKDAPPVVLLATDRASYGRLAALITRGRGNAEKGDCRLTLDDLAEHAAALLAAVKGCSDRLYAYRDIFDDRCYLLAEVHRGPDDHRELNRRVRLANRCGVPLAAAGDVHYHLPERKALHDVLVAIRHGTTVHEAGEHLFSNAERHLKSPQEMARAFAGVPGAIGRTVEIAERCLFSLDELKYEYPEELAPKGETPIGYLGRLAKEGARRRYPSGVPDKVRQLLAHELQLIESLRYEAYFLTVWDLVRFARERGILCQGRGSAANSAVCYCLGITAVDPDRIDTLFERFISRERNEAPDIDVDFEHQRREEVLQYIYEKYGRDRAGMTAEVITYRPRSAVRDVGKALGLSHDRVDRVAKQIEHFHQEPDLPARCREAGIDPENPQGRQLVSLVGQLVGFPRHLSQHTGGMVVTRGKLSEIVPIENAAMAGRTVIEWNKDDLDALGILKVDCLALGMLTAIRKCLDMVAIHYGRKLTPADIPQGDPNVYAMIRRADTMGVFQIESRAQMSMLPRLKPRTFYDLVIEVAIVRPGPIQGNMVHPYLRRRDGLEPVEYPCEAIREVLKKTLGVPLFQEQAMRLAVVAAGFTPGEADQLRRAMGAWRRPGLIDEFRRKLVDGMRAAGLSRKYAEAVFRQIRGFGDYGFPESHAASFALLVYVSAWLKCHYPAAFTASLLNSQPMGFYAPAQLVRDVRRHGVEVRPVDVNASNWESTLEPKGGDRPMNFALRLGLSLLQGMPTDDARRITAARADTPFRSLDDFTRRTGLGRAATTRLAEGGAFGSLAAGRREALWQALEQPPREMPLFDRLDSSDQPAAVEDRLPEMSRAEEVLADYHAMGLSLQGHPIAILRELLDSLGAARAADLSGLPDGKPVRVAGIVLVRQRPSTAKGITFVTLEDETGQANLIIRPDVWKRWRGAALRATVLLVHGRLQRRGLVIHVLASKLENLSDRLDDLGPRSRNFH